MCWLKISDYHSIYYEHVNIENLIPILSFFTSKIYLLLCHSERLLRKKDTHALSPVLSSAHPLQVITYLNSNLLLMIGPCFSWAVFLWYPQLLFRLTNRWSLNILLRLLTEWKSPFSVESCVEMCCPVFCDSTPVWLYSSSPFFERLCFFFLISFWGDKGFGDTSSSISSVMCIF